MPVERYLKAQEFNYQTALSELKAGRKQSHWMWYIFPQIDGLGYSPTAVYYAFRDFDEVREYLNHPILSERLHELCNVLLNLKTDDPVSVFGYTDALKLCSSMTAFRLVSAPGSVFEQVLDKYYDGQGCSYTERKYCEEIHEK